jgi:hypothetical protein
MSEVLGVGFLITEALFLRRIPFFFIAEETVAAIFLLSPPC